jgi:macrodomain Ter protein organizer (MatP/YcbG family)
MSKIKDRQKTQINLDRSIWAEVKRYAALYKLSINETLELLLTKELNKEKIDGAGNRFAPEIQQPPLETQ